MAPRGAILFCSYPRHCEERLVRRSSKSEGGSDDAIQTVAAVRFWNASRSLSSGARLRDPALPSYNFVLIPRRRETGIHAAHVLRQCRDRLAVFIVKPDVERIQIGLLAFGTRRLWDRGNAILVEQPFQRHLRRACVVLLADPGQ